MKLALAAGVVGLAMVGVLLVAFPTASPRQRDACAEKISSTLPTTAVVDDRAVGDFDGDGRADRYVMYHAASGGRLATTRLRLQLGSGSVRDSRSENQLGYGSVLSVVDVEADGDDDILIQSSGNTAVYLAVVVLDGCELRVARRAGRLMEFFYSGTGQGWLTGGPGGGVNCEDVDGDGRRELVAYERGRDGDWYRVAYRLRDARLRRLFRQRVADQTDDFAIVTDGAECAAPGPVSDGVYIAYVDEIDRASHRARFNVECRDGTASVHIPPVTLSLEHASFRVRASRNGAGRQTKTVDFRHWAAATPGDGLEIGSWRAFRRHPGVRSPPEELRIRVSRGRATTVAPNNQAGADFRHSCARAGS